MMKTIIASCITFVTTAIVVYDKIQSANIEIEKDMELVKEVRDDVEENFVTSYDQLSNLDNFLLMKEPDHVDEIHELEQEVKKLERTLARNKEDLLNPTLTKSGQKISEVFKESLRQYNHGCNLIRQILDYLDIDYQNEEEIEYDMDSEFDEEPEEEPKKPKRKKKKKRQGKSKEKAKPMKMKTYKDDEESSEKKKKKPKKQKKKEKSYKKPIEQLTVDEFEDEFGFIDEGYMAAIGKKKETNVKFFGERRRDQIDQKALKEFVKLLKSIKKVKTDLVRQYGKSAPDIYEYLGEKYIYSIFNMAVFKVCYELIDIEDFESHKQLYVDGINHERDEIMKG